MTTGAVPRAPPPVLKAVQAIADLDPVIVDPVIVDPVIVDLVIVDPITAVREIADHGKDAGCRTGVPMGAVRKSGARAIAVLEIGVPKIEGPVIGGPVNVGPVNVGPVNAPKGWDPAGGCRRCANASGRRSNGISTNCASGSAS